MGRRLRKQYKRECKWNNGKNCEVQSSSRASLGGLTSLPILAVNFLLLSEILSQKHRKDPVITHVCLNHTNVSSPNLCAFVNLLPCWGSGRKQIMDICEVKSLSCFRLFATSWTVAYQAPLSPWDFPGNSIGMDCHFLLQGIFLTQGSNPGLPHCRQTLYRLSHQGTEVVDICVRAANRLCDQDWGLRLGMGAISESCMKRRLEG